MGTLFRLYQRCMPCPNLPNSSSFPTDLLAMLGHSCSSAKAGRLWLEARSAKLLLHLVHNS